MASRKRHGQNVTVSFIFVAANSATKCRYEDAPRGIGRGLKKGCGESGFLQTTININIMYS